MSYKMTVEEREAFLADLHVGVIGIDAPGRAPIVVPVWYMYEPGGEIKLVTNKGSVKEKLLRENRRFSLCVQDEAPPYSYVSVEGPVFSMEETDREQSLLPIAVRYLGKEEGRKYVDDAGDEPEILVRMRPERWSTADFGKE